MSVTIENLGDDGRQWFRLDGRDIGTGYEFESSVYGIDADGTLLDEDGYPLHPGTEQIAVESWLQ